MGVAWSLRTPDGTPTHGGSISCTLLMPPALERLLQNCFGNSEHRAPQPHVASSVLTPQMPGPSVLILLRVCCAVVSLSAGGPWVPRCCQHTTRRREGKIQHGESTRPVPPTGASDAGPEQQTVVSRTNTMLTGLLFGYLGVASVPLGEGVRNPEGIWEPRIEQDLV